MKTFDLETFMKRVDQTTTDEQLTNLQEEFSAYAGTLSDVDRQVLIQAYMTHMSVRRRSIANQLEELRNEKVSA